MKITKIESQRNPERVNIYIDKEFAFGLFKDLVFKYSLKKGMKVNDDFINDILLEEEQKKVIDTALNYISYRVRSEKEVYDRLKEDDYEEEHILDAIEYCKEYNYINDESFAESFVKDKINLNKHGSFRIRQELQQKGVNDSIINKLLASDDTEYERALELAKKRIRTYRKDDYQAKYRKMSGYLQRRGYPFDIVNRVLREVLEDE